MRSVMFREETRWPGYYFRSDFPTMDEKNWRVFVNCRWDSKTDKWEMMKKPVLNFITAKK